MSKELPDMEERRPEVAQLKEELKRVKHKTRFRNSLKSTLFTLVVVAACAVLIAVLFLPVLRIYGTSMNPTLYEGNIVVSLKTTDIKRGDVIGVYFGSKLLIKRCIATEHQWVNIDKDGNVYVDNKLIEEPYLTEKALGECDIELPYQVPDGAIFVMGDHRATSIDSRNTSVGCIDTDNIVGKIVFRVWPLKDFGSIKQ